MARDGKLAQKAAQKRKEREKRVREAAARKRQGQESHGTRRVLTAALELPVEECVISQGWRERGLAHILLTRRRPDGRLLVGGYFVDTLCLGLKESMTVPALDAGEFEKRVKPSVFKDPVVFEPCDPGVARAVVEGAIAFAGGWGFHPNRRWEDSRRVFDGIDPKPEGLVFGREGVPCLVLRPGENLAGAKLRLERKAGPGRFLVVDETPPT